MALFKYNAFNKQGKSVSGTIESPTLQNAKDMVRAKGLMPISIKEVSTLAKEGFSLASLFEKKVDVKNIILFTKQMSILLRAGVPLLQSVDILSNQFEGQLRRMLINIKDNIKEGKSFADSLEKYPKVFSRVYVQLVRAGEASGKLESILDSLTGYMEKAADIKKKVKKAMFMPIMTLSLSVIVIAVLVTYAVPKMVEAFAGTGGSLPWPTLFLKNLSDFIMNNYYFLIIGLFVLVVFFKYWKSTPTGRLMLDRFYLKLPLISYFIKTKVVVDFSKTLGLLLGSGVNLAEGFDIVCNIIDNSVLTTALKKARDKIIKEGKISQYLKETNIFPPIAIYMISTGEQSGKLAELLSSVGVEYDVELSDLVDGLVAKINPIMLLVVGGIVLFIVAAIMLPIQSLSEGMMGSESMLT